MPIFYFDVVEINGTFKQDTVGIGLIDAAAAKAVAAETFADMARDAIHQDLSQLRVVVRDSDGNKILQKVAYFDEE